MTTGTTAFDVCGPLPAAGVTVLEASAGTGKTFTIAALAARYVAEGRKLEDLLLVTFTRMATGELRERVRDRLVSAEHGLEKVLAGEEPSDDLVALLAREDTAIRRERLARAIADFDAATIVTTHGFCQEVLSGLGIAGDVEADVTFVEDMSDLVDEVVDDLYVRRFFQEEGTAFDRSQALEIADLAVRNPAAPILPDDGSGVAGMRARLAQAVRDELELRKRRGALMTYDDLLTRLDDALEDDDVAQRLGRRYRIVLVDEFQDTDPVQWNIMRRAFGSGDGTLVLIGDPKQAIYAFRGADVYAYLAAAKEAGERPTLERNFRSDQGLLDAYDALFAGARLGHEGIVYRDVKAAHTGARFTGAPDPAPLRIRVLCRDDPAVRTGQGGTILVDSARERIADDVAADIVRLLSSGACVEDEDICPRHVAVLVRTNKAAALVRDALEEVGVPAVINGAGSVFGTPQARHWLRLLEAIERPTSTGRARTAALTPFLGWSSVEVASADEVAWEEVHQRLHRWARVLRVKGVASLLEEITLTEGLPERVLREAGGERRMTDLRHVGQLLHAAARTEHLGATALTGWLRKRIAEADRDTADEERSRRLESDAEAVQVLTIHRSKGLEFPVVYLPYLWDPTYVPEKSVPIAFHDPDNGDRRTLDVGLEGTSYSDHRRQHLAEERGEELRLAYVALTRARHQAVVWWAASTKSRDSSLSRLLFARDEHGNIATSAKRLPSDAEAFEAFEALGRQAAGCISVERSVIGSAAHWSPTPSLPAELSAAAFNRDVDWRWRRTSFSDITAGTHELRVGSEPEEPLLTDELDVEAPTSPADAELAAPSLLADMPAGVQVGTFIHSVFESVDFAALDLTAEVTASVAAARARRAVELGDLDAVTAGLSAVIETPLGPLLDGARLRDVERRDRLDELAFELPLVGGDSPSAKLTLEAIASVLRDHDEAYAERLRDPALRHSVRGYLTGSIDLVLRRGEQFAIVDYKTNWLGTPGSSELTAWHHRPEAVARVMEQSHYSLQALLYTVALHRYLRWRLPGYDVERHFAGVLYLFVRGMTGRDTPVVDGMPCGVYSWQPSPALVNELSDLFDRGDER